MDVWSLGSVHSTFQGIIAIKISKVLLGLRPSQLYFAPAPRAGFPMPQLQGQGLTLTLSHIPARSTPCLRSWFERSYWILTQHYKVCLKLEAVR